MNENLPALPAPNSTTPPSAPSSNGSNGEKRGKFTGELVQRLRPSTYRRVIDLIAQDVSDNQIAALCKVSRSTVPAIRLRESATIEQKKTDLANRLLRITRQSSEIVEDKLPKATIMQAATVMGISADKALNMLGQVATTQVAVIMPSETERVERRQMDAKLDALMAKLNAPPAQADDIKTQ